MPGTTINRPGRRRARRLDLERRADQPRDARPAPRCARAPAPSPGSSASMPSARRSSSARLVSTVTPRIFTLPAAASAARDSISKPPEVCTVSSSALDARRRRHRARHRLGDVVQLEVQEDAPAARPHRLDGALALGHEQLEPDLVERRPPVQPIEQRRQRPPDRGRRARRSRARARGMSCASVSSSHAPPRPRPRPRARPRRSSSCAPPARCARFTSTTPSASPFLPTAMRNGMPIRSASLNFTPGALVAVVVQHLDAGRGQLVVDPRRGRDDARVVLLQVQHRDLVRRERHRPDDAVLVVVLLDGRRRRCA